MYLRERSSRYPPFKTGEELCLSAHQPDSVTVGRGGGINLWLLPGTQASRFPFFRQLMERSGCYLPSATAKLHLSAHQLDLTIEEQVGQSMVNGTGTGVAAHQGEPSPGVRPPVFVTLECRLPSYPSLGLEHPSLYLCLLSLCSELEYITLTSLWYANIFVWQHLRRSLHWVQV